MMHACLFAHIIYSLPSFASVQTSLLPALLRAALAHHFSSEDFKQSLWESEPHHVFLRLCVEVRLNRRLQGRWGEIGRRLEAGESCGVPRKLLRHAFALFMSCGTLTSPTSGGQPARVLSSLNVMAWLPRR